jgi:anti-anti-sigma regulatory factor
VDHVRENIADRVQAEAAPPKLVILDLSAAPYVDLQGVNTLAALAERIGEIDRFTSIAYVVDNLPQIG